jgi:hypothetical protein
LIKSLGSKKALNTAEYLGRGRQREVIMNLARQICQGHLIALIVFGWGLASPAQQGTGQEVKTVTAAPPYLRVVGTLSGGSATARPGDEVSVFGSGFCARPDCSDVTLSIGDHVVLQGVKTNADGSFRGRFRVAEPPGLYLVRASQQAGQAELEDGKPLIVPVRE